MLEMKPGGNCKQEHEQQKEHHGRVICKQRNAFVLEIREVQPPL